MIETIIEKYLKENFKIGKVYHQDFKNGERTFFKPLEKQKNGKFKGYITDTGKPNRTKVKIKKGSADPTLPFWKETPENEIPKNLYNLFNKNIK